MTSKHIIGFIVGIGAFFVGRSVASNAVDAYRLRSWKGNTPYERAFARALRAENAFDDLVRFVRNAESEGIARDSASYLTRNGLMRLSPDDQALRLALIDQALGATPVESCAAYHAGTSPAATVNALTTAMDSSSLDQFSRVVVRAMLAELRQTREPATASEQQTIDFFEDVAASLDSASSTRLLDALTQPRTAAPRDMCWAGRTLYQTALAKEGEARAEAVRVITAIEASSPAPR